MSTDRATVIEKVCGLIRLADPEANDSLPERAAAFHKAQSLIDEHDLEREEVEAVFYDRPYSPPGFVDVDYWEPLTAEWNGSGFTVSVNIR